MTNEICVQCLECYNNSKLIFKWYDIVNFDTIEAMYEDFYKEHDKTHEELMIADYSDFPNMGEYPAFEEINEVIKLMNNFDSDAVKVFIEHGYDPADFEELYQGQYDSMVDFAEEFVNSCYSLEDPLASYFDYEGFARDLELSGDYWEDSGHVFSS